MNFLLSKKIKVKKDEIGIGSSTPTIICEHCDAGCVGCTGSCSGSCGSGCSRNCLGYGGPVPY